VSVDRAAVSTKRTAVSTGRAAASASTGRRPRTPSAAARRGTILRSLGASTLLLGRRRARRDAPLLVGWIALLCLAALLALAVPRLVLDTVDRGARAAVAEVGSAADLLLRAGVGDRSTSPQLVTLAELDELALLVPQNLPAALSRVTGTPSTSVQSPTVRMVREDGGASDVRVEGQFALLGGDQQRGLTLVEGRLPAESAEGDGIEVVVSSEAADVASLAVGSVLGATATVSTTVGPPASVSARVVGIVASTQPATADRCAPEWCDLPLMWAPDLTDSRGGGSKAEVVLLTSAAGVASVQPLFLDPLPATIRLPLRAERFTGAIVDQVIAETDRLEASSASLSEGSTASVDVRTDFPEAMRPFGDRAAASVAQMSLMIAGLFGAVTAALLLIGGLLVRRRLADLSLERARGASLGSIALRGLAESAALAVVGIGAGVALAALLVPGKLSDPWPLVVVCAFAVLAPPTQALLVARAAWSGRRQPANRRDRQQLAARARGRRIVLEAAVVLLAVAALASVRARGLVEARTDGTDPLLAAAPLLLAVAVTAVVLRVQPLAVRAATAIASRARGAVGLLGAAHAERSVAVLPLLALTLCAALVVGGSLIVQTVREGQVAASWERVGADARVEGLIAGDAADAARDAPGVDAASAVLSRSAVEVDSGAASAPATVVAVDGGFAKVAALLPAGAAPGQADLDRLAAASGSADTLPVLVDRRLAARVDVGEAVLVLDDERIPLRVVATFDGGPDGYLADPFVYADLGALGALLPEPPAADTLLVMGQGAGAAAQKVDGATEVVTRAEWLDERREQPLVQGVDRMTQLIIAAVALLAALALVTTVASGARSRSRSLSLLRTLGVPRRFGWVLALAELAPLVVAALLGGTAAGAGILVVVGPALGLRILAGGVGEPALHLDIWTVVSVIAGCLALAAVAIVVDIVAHRRDRPGEVLRVGETS
jgi:putative ABC transport system permease protein